MVVDGVTHILDQLSGALILGYFVEEMLGQPALSFHIPEVRYNATKGQILF